MTKAVFIDRDGTLNRMVYDETHGVLDSPRRPEQLEPIPGAGAFIKSVKSLGYLVIVVSNQPGLSKGTLTVDELETLNVKLRAALEAEGAAWDDCMYAAYHPDHKATVGVGPEYSPDYRKPKPGMLLAAASRHDIDLKNSWMIGDGLVDVQAGHAAGCHTILVTTLKMEQIERFLNMENACPDYVVPNLDEALQHIGGARHSA